MAKFSFLPGEVKFYDYFERASANLVEGARLLQDLLDHCEDIPNKVAQITEVEHKGDFIVHEVTDLLPRTLITPIDNDDIQRLIVAVDDAMDAIEETAAHIQIYQIDTIKKPAKRLGKLILEGAQELHEAFGGLRDKSKYKEVNEHVIRINTIENNGDRILRDGLVELVAHRDDMFEFFRWKQIYEYLEDTTDRLEDAGDVIQKVIIANA